MHFMTQFYQRSRYVFQGFPSVQADFQRLSGRHSFDTQLGANKG
ncbi:hypothetical protein N826_21985 [Skermanella aerolata KACC 11604]|nr:hypothetical protein N826_21985 [Skermanella aerolata KACC 11604]